MNAFTKQTPPARKSPRVETATRIAGNLTDTIDKLEQNITTLESLLQGSIVNRHPSFTLAGAAAKILSDKDKATALTAASAAARKEITDANLPGLGEADIDGTILTLKQMVNVARPGTYEIKE